MAMTVTNREQPSLAHPSFHQRSKPNKTFYVYNAALLIQRISDVDI